MTESKPAEPNLTDAVLFLLRSDFVTGQVIFSTLAAYAFARRLAREEIVAGPVDLPVLA